MCVFEYVSIGTVVYMYMMYIMVCYLIKIQHDADQM